MTQKIVTVADSWVSIDIHRDGLSHGPHHNADHASEGGVGLLIVPGVMSDAHAWRHVARAVTRWGSVAILNRRGRTPSGPLTASYSLESEVADLSTVIDRLGPPRALFGWSYGASIALMLASRRAVRHLIAYEPVAPSFGAPALPALAQAHHHHDTDRSVEIVNLDVSGFSRERVAALRGDRAGWSTLKRLSEPLYPELRALAESEFPRPLAERATRIDLLIGELNVDRAPYGTTFDEVRTHLARSETHVLPGQGHLAHIQAPHALAELLDSLAA